jgi:FAD/FMN-containing dehydrogenase
MSESILKGLTGSEVVVSDSDMRAFEAGLKGSLFRPGSAQHEEARHLWNGLIDKRPGLIVRCRDVADVRACIDLARDRGVLLAVRAGGHNVAGNATCDGGLVVDLSEMRAVRLDPKQGVVHIEAGAKLGDVDGATYPHGLATPMGVVTATGYAGLTLHGGMGWQLRKHGLAADNLTAVDILTADGRLRHADSKEHPELFWALRGGGGNFGIVTSFTARLHPIPREVLFAVPIFPLDSAGEVLRFLREYIAQAPDALMVLAAFWTAPEIPEIPAKHRGGHALFVLGCYLGPAQEGESLLAPLRSCRPTIADLTSRMPWVEVQKFFDPDYPNGRRYYWKSTFVHELTDPIIGALASHAAARPSMLSSLDLWCLGGTFGRIGPSETAFGARDAGFLVTYEANWDDREADQANIDWARASLRQIEGLTRGRTYLNFAGLAEEGERLVRSSFGDNYARLQAVKATYDPQNLFRSNFNVRPNGQGPHPA